MNIVVGRKEGWVDTKVNVGRFFWKQAKQWCWAVSAGLWLAGGAVARAEVAPPTITPAWNVPQSNSRLMVTKARDNFFMVKLPLRAAQGVLADIKVYWRKEELPHRVLWLDEEEAWVLVDASRATVRETIKVYPVPGEQVVSVGSGTAHDATPLRGFAQRTAGMDFPASLEELRMLESRLDRKPAWFYVAETAGLAATFKEWFHGDWTRKNHLVDLQTWILVPADDVYRFGLAGVAPCWLLVDDKPTLAHPAGQPFDKWTSGRAVKLKAGMRCLRVRTVVRQQIDTGLAWKRADDAAGEFDMQMATGGDLVEGRWEQKERPLHAYATATPGGAYRFLQNDAEFVPFELSDRSASWVGEYAVNWSLAGAAPWSQERKATLVLTRKQLPAQVELRASVSEQNAQYALTLDSDAPLVAEYAISTRITDVPAVCRLDDLVKPIIRVRTTAPDQLGYELSWEMQFADGAARQQSVAINAQQGWVRHYLDEVSVADLRTIKWSVKHQGVELVQGKARFLQQPFALLPDRVSGENLMYGDQALYFVVTEASSGQPGRGLAVAPSETLLLDGFLYGGLVAEGQTAAERLGCRVVDLQDIESSDDASGIATLRPLALLQQELPVRGVVLAPLLTLAQIDDGLQVFERRLSAMVALLRSQVAAQPRVILVVPPHLTTPAASTSPNGAERELAATVIRVADVHGVECVDLYSAFQTVSGETALVSEGLITAAGLALAEELILKKLAGF